MVTRQEIVKEMDELISKNSKELSILKERHESEFSEEHKKDEIRKDESNRLWRLKEKLILKKYEGNWGNRENWNRGNIPENFKFKEEDNQEIKEALTEIMREKDGEIAKSKEYINLSREYDKVCFSNFSKEHIELDKKIEDLERTIRYAYEKKEKISTKGGLIEESKRRKEHERYEEEYRKKIEKIKMYKEKILAWKIHSRN